MEDWIEKLSRGQADDAWDLFIARHRRLVFSAIRHYAQDYDDVMDVFAHVCEALRRDNMLRLRKYTDAPAHTARFGTWLVAVVRNLTVDWFRLRDGRHRLPGMATSLPPLQRQIFEHIFLQQRSHIECYELLHVAGWPDLTHREFLAQLRATYAAVEAGRHGRIMRDIGAYPPAEAESEEHAIDARLSGKRALEALASLSEEDRLAVQLYVIDELDAESVARILGWPGGKTVYNRVYRALAAVRAQLEDAGLRRVDL